MTRFFANHNRAWVRKTVEGETLLEKHKSATKWTESFYTLADAEIKLQAGDWHEIAKSAPTECAKGEKA